MSFSLCAAANLPNTADIDCDISKGVLDRLYIYNGEIAAADYATPALFLTKLIANSKKSRNDSEKIFPLSLVYETTDKSEANKTGTLGYGFTQILREGLPSYEVKLRIGNTLYKQLRKFNNQTVRLLEYDKNTRFWGTQVGTKFKGYQANLFIDGGKVATGQNVEEKVCTLTISILDNSEYKDNSYYMPILGNITSIVGLKDVVLTEASAHVANVWKVAVKVPTSQIGGYLNMYDQYSTQLAAAGLWTATSTHPTTGVVSALAITSVAVDAALKAWTVTLDSTAYTALTAGSIITINLAAPPTLDTADVTGIEGSDLAAVK